MNKETSLYDMDANKENIYLIINKVIETIQMFFNLDYDTTLGVRFIIRYNECVIHVILWKPIDKYRIDVALRNRYDTDSLPIEINGYVENEPVIEDFNIPCLTAFLLQFQSIKSVEFSEVWDAWHTIVRYL